MSPGNASRPGGRRKQQRQFAIGASVMGEIVVHDQHVAAGFHKRLCDAGRGVRRNVSESRWIVAFRHDHDGVVHRPFSRNLATTFATADARWPIAQSDAYDVLVPLVEYRVNRDGRFACLSIAQNQLALAAANGNQPHR